MGDMLLPTRVRVRLTQRTVTTLTWNTCGGTSHISFPKILYGRTFKVVLASSDEYYRTCIRRQLYYVQNIGTLRATHVQLHPIIKPSEAFLPRYGHHRRAWHSYNGQEYVIVIIGAFSKYVLLYHPNYKLQHSTYCTLAALKQTIHLFGAPRQLIVDKDGAFLGEFKNYYMHFGIDVHAISSGISRANDRVERVVWSHVYVKKKTAMMTIRNDDTCNGILMAVT